MTIKDRYAEQFSVIFLGGVFLPSQHKQILTNSRGVVQNAADALQKAFLHGLSDHLGNKVQLVNLPFVGSYPRLYVNATFPACEDTLAPGIRVRGEGFLNIRFLRFWSRFISAFFGVHRATRDAECPVIIVYSAHLPFLAAVRLVRLLRRDVFLCAVLPDLPEFMGVGGWLYSTFKVIESAIFRQIVQGFDSFVFLTDAMGDRIGIPAEKRMVVEGIFDPLNDLPEGAPVDLEDDAFVVLYTGTLAARYGIGDLLEAFEHFDNPKAQLWICGDGDTRHLIDEMAQRDPRIRFFGQVPRAKALALQRTASVLVNPRRPEGEFTKYSFPSKTMEYLASGKQVIMHRLPGIPREYLEHLTIPATPDAEGLAEALRDVSVLTAEERNRRGNNARMFILNCKSPEAQVARVLDHWAKLRGRNAAREVTVCPA